MVDVIVTIFGLTMLFMLTMFVSALCLGGVAGALWAVREFSRS